jgi:Carbohydrate-binding module 48 (Isoamylase N-terminal domain)
MNGPLTPRDGAAGPGPRDGATEPDLVARAAAAYRASLPALDASLDTAVRAAVRGRPRRAAVPLWRWPLHGRVRPVWIPLAAAAAAAAVWLAVPRAAPPPAVQVPAAVAAAPDTVFVQFQLAAPRARSVALAGSFDGWDPHALPMTRRADGVWAITIPLPVGEHTYQFVVDGSRWEPDPGAGGRVADGYGGTNSVIVVGPKGQVQT